MKIGMPRIDFESTDQRFNSLLESGIPCEENVIQTPEFFWKTIITRDPNTGTAKAISWIIPNEANLGSLDNYLVTIADLEELLGASYVAINAPASLKNMLPATTWPQPAGCDLG